MTKQELKALYERACNTRRIKPQQDEAGQWWKNLQDFEPRDAQEALDAWWASTERDKDGELKSKWLPVPGELMAMVIKARDKRIARSREPEDMLWFQCGAGHRSMGFVVRSTPDPVGKRCHCGAGVEVVKREAA